VTAEDRRSVHDTVVSAWCSVLSLETASPDDDFFLLGGHSLLAVELAERLEEELGFEFPLRPFFADPRLETLVDIYDRHADQKRFAAS